MSLFTCVCLWQDLLYNLEESIAEQTDVARPSPAQRDSLDGLDREEPEDRQQPQKYLDEAMIRTFLSAKNLKSVRNNSSRNSSGCFGRRMDRIGSMSSLGCNTVGRYSKCPNIQTTAATVQLQPKPQPSYSLFSLSDPKSA